MLTGHSWWRRPRTLPRRGDRSPDGSPEPSRRGRARSAGEDGPHGADRPGIRRAVLSSGAGCRSDRRGVSRNRGARQAVGNRRAADSGSESEPVERGTEVATPVAIGGRRQVCHSSGPGSLADASAIGGPSNTSIYRACADGPNYQYRTRRQAGGRPPSSVAR